MQYNQLPNGTKLSNEQFLSEMNSALHALSGYKVGMQVKGDSSGYWLEFNGVRYVDDNDLLASAKRQVLGKN